MVKSLFWTPSGARLQLFRGSEGSPLNWLFLPGGPGLGSESLLPLLNTLELSGSLWQLDLPGDGSNTTANDYDSFSRWPTALIEAVSAFKHVVLVAHSTGGMFALSVPEIEGLLSGLVLLDSAPDAGWQASFTKQTLQCPIPGLGALQEQYRAAPSSSTLKTVTVASAPYLFTEKGMTKGIAMLNSLPYNCGAHAWAEEHFDSTYHTKWIPQTIPTLLLSGEEDQITPLQLFIDKKKFHRDNISFRSIQKAGHFPWIDNPQAVIAAFNKYVQTNDI